MSAGKRRPKVPRATLRDFSPTSIQQGRQARRRDRVVKLAVAGLAVVITAALVYGPGPPFTFRLGQRPDRDIRVNVPEFFWLDPIRTTTQRQAAADAVPPSMVNEPAP